MKRTVLATVLLSLLIVPGAARANSVEALVFEETRQEIPNGSEISLWEQFNLQGFLCQAQVPATLVVNGQSTDSASGPVSPTWDECGSTTVTGGFTSIQFNPQTVAATASAGVSIAESNGCVFELGKVEGSYSPIGEEPRAAWKIAGNATLTKGSSCPAELHVEGFIELFPRGAGSPLPWKSVESLEGAMKERESKEKEKASREEKERHEPDSVLSLTFAHWKWAYNRHYTIVRELTLEGVPTGAAVRVSCRGRGCPFGHARLAAVGTHLPCRARRCTSRSPMQGPTFTLARVFKGRRLAPGTSIIVSIVKPGFVGEAFVFVTRSGKEPRQKHACLAPGTTQPERAC